MIWPFSRNGASKNGHGSNGHARNGRSPDHVARTPKSLPRVGDPDADAESVDAGIDSRLVVFSDPQGRQAEQYRGFRTNLRAMNPNDEPRTLLFTSAQPRAGKSISVANIALAMAETEHLKVCLVDADLRAGRVAQLFGARMEPGLADVMLDKVPPNEALQSSCLPNLTLLTAGRFVHKPGEVLASDYMQELIAWLKRSHDYILFDSPPSMLFADAAELGRLADGVVLVVAIGDTTQADADNALTQLNKVGANLIGSFVTGAPPLDQYERDTVPEPVE
ncbi:MAG: CpsD/CapB family tyrosine-protein kinase [Planctomycetota bacterium]|jgi:capsular exopolysaccharide synthesis family protein